MGVFQNGNGLFTRHVGKTIQIFLETKAAFQVGEKAVHRHTRAFDAFLEAKGARPGACLTGGYYIRSEVYQYLGVIKNLGEAIAGAVIAEREANGHYQSFSDFLERVTHKDLNKKSLESLIRAGAFDSMGEDRGALLHNIDRFAIEAIWSRHKPDEQVVDAAPSGAKASNGGSSVDATALANPGEQDDALIEELLSELDKPKGGG